MPSVTTEAAFPDFLVTSRAQAQAAESAMGVYRAVTDPLVREAPAEWRQTLTIDRLQVGDDILLPRLTIVHRVERIAQSFLSPDLYNVLLRSNGGPDLNTYSADDSVEVYIPRELMRPDELQVGYRIMVEPFGSPILITGGALDSGAGVARIELANPFGGAAPYRIELPRGEMVTAYRLRSTEAMPEVDGSAYATTPEPTITEGSNSDMLVQLDSIPCKRCERHRYESDYAPRVWRQGLLGAEIICRSCVQARRARNASSGDRTFGIEIEFGGDHEPLAEYMTEGGVLCYDESYNHETKSYWKIVSDSSIELDSGGELVSPILSGERGFKDLAVACDGLSVECYTDRSCGVHVHHGASDLTSPQLRRLAFGWAQNQDAIDMMVHPDRKAGNGSWCHPLTEYDFGYLLEYSTNIMRGASNLDRYRSLNMVPLARYGTVEVRSMHCTFEYDYLASWIRFGQSFITAAKRGVVQPFADAGALLDFLTNRGGLDSSDAHILSSKADRFASVGY